MSRKRLLLVLSALFVAVLFAGPASAAWFLRMDGFPGQSVDPKHSGWIELQSFNLGGQSHLSFGPGQQEAAKGASKGSGKMFLSFTFKLVAVKTVSWAHDDSVNGKPVPRAVLEGTKPDGQVYVRFVLHDCIISGFQGRGGGRDGAVVTNSLTLNYPRIEFEDLEPKPTPTHAAVKPVVAAPKAVAH